VTAIPEMGKVGLILASADRLSVDLGGLEEFSATLETIRASMSGAPGWMREFDDELGGPEVQNALSHFESQWSDGRGQVDKNCVTFIKLVKQAVENIRKTDDDLRDSLVQSGETK
jgi:hypothetical protein